MAFRGGITSRNLASLFAIVLVVVVLGYGVWFSELAPRGPFRLVSVKTHELRSGIEVIDVTYDHSSGPGGRMLIVYADPSAITPQIQINRDRTPIARIDPSAFFVVNAGFFTPEWRPTGLLVSSRTILSPFVKQAGAAGSGVLVVRGDRVELFERDQVTPKDYEGADLALQAGPRVIEEHGQPGIRSDDGERANRTVIGRDQRGRLAVGVVLGLHGWSTGPTLFELQKLLGPPGIGRHLPDHTFACALNLDGGPSTGFALREAAFRADSAETSPVQNVLSLRSRR